MFEVHNSSTEPVTVKVQLIGKKTGKNDYHKNGMNKTFFQLLCCSLPVFVKHVMIHISSLSGANDNL